MTMYTFDKAFRILLSVASIFVLYLLVNSLSGALLPFLIAWLLAYILNPIVEFVQHRCRVRNRAVSIILTLLLFIAILVGGIVLLIPPVTEEITVLNQVISTEFTQEKICAVLGIEPAMFESWWIRTFQNRNPVEVLSGYLSKEDWQSIAENFFSQVWNLISGSMSFIYSLVSGFMILLYMFFILLDYHVIASGAINLIPKKYRETSKMVIQDVETAMNRYFRGQSLVALSVGILFSIGFLIIGLPMAIVLGLFIGLLNMVPYLQIIGVIPTFLLCLIKSVETNGDFFWIFLSAMAVFLVVQLIQDLLIVPKIMGKVTGMNPAVILLSLSIWGSLMGIVGMIIALPLTTIVISYYSRFVLKNDLEEPPTPAEPDKK